MKDCIKCKFNYEDICEPRWEPEGPHCEGCVRWSKEEGCLCVKCTEKGLVNCPDFTPKEDSNEKTEGKN